MTETAAPKTTCPAKQIFIVVLLVNWYDTVPSVVTFVVDCIPGFEREEAFDLLHLIDARFHSASWVSTRNLEGA